MQEYWEQCHEEVKKYISIFHSEVPKFLEKYFEVPAIKRLGSIGFYCGMNYASSHIYSFSFPYSRLDHSLVVALITWHFTSDKKATIAALLHDIATPAFSHVIDYAKDDKMTQTYTEIKTTDMIQNSKELCCCLKEDKIRVEDVIDASKYSIVDNKRPRLCADRLDGTLMNLIYWGHIIGVEDVKDIYAHVIVVRNEEEKLELGFDSFESAKHFFNLALKCGYLFVQKEDSLCMNYLADIIKILLKTNEIKEEDFYHDSEEELILKFLSSKNENIRKKMHIFQTMEKVYLSDTYVEKTYCIDLKNKKMRLDPLFMENRIVKRVTEVDESSKEALALYDQYQEANYAYIVEDEFV